MALSAANRVALAHAAALAESERPRHVARIRSVLAAARVHPNATALLDAVRRGGSVTMNFHPDRLLADGRSVAQALDDEGVYRSQFEARISNGGSTAYPGGDRVVCEHALFASAYQRPDVLVRERPKYGGLNLMNHLNGACPRFGSCHLRLRRAATERATLIFGDSAAKPTDIGLIGAFEPVLAPLLEAVASGAGALGRSIDVRAFVEGLLRRDHARAWGVFAPAMTHALNDYIEAHVHGELRSEVDVDAVVIDPAFRDLGVGELLLEAARRHGFQAEWHAGLVLALSDVPQDAPSATPVDVPPHQPVGLMRWQVFCANGRALRLAERVVEGHGAEPRLDAANIGRAAVSVVREPERWRDWGEPHEVLVHLKDLWLMLVAHGQPPR
jgi:GNAT superfamily N-acetyltransferase